MATTATTKPKPRMLNAAEIENITSILRARMATWASAIQQDGPVNYQFDDLTDVSADLSEEMPPMIVIVFNVPESERGKTKHVLNPF